MAAATCRKLLASCVLLALGEAAHAQAPTWDGEPAAPPTDASKTEPATTDPRTLDRVVVTGTRIPRAGFDTLEPAQVIGREYLDDTGTTNIANAIFNEPGFSAGASIFGGQSSFGTGVSFASQFSLGSNRLLGLINGRRYVTSNPPTIFGPASEGVQVDLNAIPANLVDHIESISIGGAPTYGSDAISGVTNIILRDDFEGLETRIGYGQTERGDGNRYHVSALLGSKFAQDRGHFVLSLGQDSQDGLLSIDRAYVRHGYALQRNPSREAVERYQPGRNPATDGRLHGDIPFDTGSGDGVPASVYIRNNRSGNMTWGGVLLPATGRTTRDSSGQLRGFGPGQDQSLQFDRQGNLVAYDPGVNFGTNGSASGGDGVNLAEAGQLISDVDRSQAYLLGKFELTDALEAFWEASWYGAQARELVDQNTYNAIGFGTAFVDGSGAKSGAYVIRADHPLLNDQARQVLRAHGIERFRLSRSSRDLSVNNASSSTHIWRGVAGLRGYFEAAGRNFDWEASLNRGRGRFVYNGTGVIQQNLINALNVRRQADGQVVCDSTRPGTTVDPACIPLSLFGEGAPSAAAKGYVVTPTRATAQTDQAVFNANITGGIVDLPGGELTFNGGYEYHREAARFTPSDYQQRGLGRAVPIAPNAGAFHTDEFFAELFAPLVDSSRGLPGLSRLDLTGKIRRVRNSVNGWFTAYTYGLQYEPVEGIQLRGNKTRSFRSPSVAELYTTRQSAFYFIPEPCQASNINAGPRPDRRRANCAAFFAGHPDVDPNTFQAAGSSVLGYLEQGDPLRNEQADAWTAGIVFQPSWADGLRLSADWYDIRITDVIDSLSASDIANGCFDADEFDTRDVDRANRFCRRISRDPRSAVADGISTTFINGPYINFAAWSTEASYRLDMTQKGWGRGVIDAAFYGYFPRKWERAAALGIAAVNEVGTGGGSLAERQYKWSLSYRLGKFKVGTDLYYTSSTAIAANLTLDSRDFQKRESTTTADLQLTYRLSDYAQMNLAVTNVTDDVGPFPYVNDLIGRRYMFTTKFNF